MHSGIEAGVSVVSARGELDAFAAPDLTSCFEESDGLALLVDLTDVSFLDSTALGVIARAVRTCRERGRAARVVLPATSARRIFEITTLDRVLPVAGSRASALAELAGVD